jgi:hypothetical protein
VRLYPVLAPLHRGKSCRMLLMKPCHCTFYAIGSLSFSAEGLDGKVCNEVRYVKCSGMSYNNVNEL